MTGLREQMMCSHALQLSMRNDRGWMISRLGHTIIQIRAQTQVRLVKQTNKPNQIRSIESKKR